MDAIRKGLDSAYDMHINPGRSRNILSRGSIGGRANKKKAKRHIPKAKTKAIVALSAACHEGSRYGCFGFDLCFA